MFSTDLFHFQETQSNLRSASGDIIRFIVRGGSEIAVRCSWPCKAGVGGSLARILSSQDLPSTVKTLSHVPD